MDTATTVELTLHAQKPQPRAAVVAPCFYGYDDSALFTFYKTVADAASGFPILLYNIPSCAKNALSAELIGKLADTCENIVGIKDSSGSMPFITRLIGQSKNGFAVINGADEQGYRAILAGSKAVVSGSSNGYTISIRICKQLQKAISRGPGKPRSGSNAHAASSSTAAACRLKNHAPPHCRDGCVRPPQRELTAVEKKNIAGASKNRA